MRSWGAENTESERQWLLRPLICFPFIAGILLSWPLWHRERIYPPAPLFDWLNLPARADLTLSYMLLGLLLVTAISRSRTLLFAALSCYVLLVLLDQSRLQPWAYMYALLLLLSGFISGKAEASSWVLPAVRLVLCADYFWSGLKKLNAGFGNEVFPWFIEPVTRHLPGSATALVHEYWYLAALAESAVALLLFFPRSRGLGIVCAVGMHILILYCLGPLGHNWNSVVWPWNIALSGLVIFAFGTPDVAWHVVSRTREQVLRGPALAAVLLVCFLLPGLSFFNRWDEYLSFALYSGNVSTAQLQVSSSTLSRMPRELANRAWLCGEDRFAIDIYSWSFEELSVPAYPEQRVFIALAREMQRRYGEKPGDIELIVVRKAPLFGRAETVRLSGRLLAP